MMKDNTIRETVAAVYEGGKDFFQSEVALARLEIGDQVSRAMAGTKAMAVGGVLLLVAFVLLVIGGILLLAEHVGLPGAFFTVGGIFVLFALVFLLFGRLMFARTSLMPRRSMARLSRNVRQLTEASRPGARK